MIRSRLLITAGFVDDRRIVMNWTSRLTASLVSSSGSFDMLPSIVSHCAGVNWSSLIMHFLLSPTQRVQSTISLFSRSSFIQMMHDILSSSQAPPKRVAFLGVDIYPWFPRRMVQSDLGRSSSDSSSSVLIRTAAMYMVQGHT